MPLTIAFRNATLIQIAKVGGVLWLVIAKMGVIYWFPIW